MRRMWFSLTPMKTSTRLLWSTSFFRHKAGGVGGAVGRVGKRRGVYSSATEELVLEDDYCDEQMLPEKKRRLTPEQVQLLEQSFEVENKLEPERKCELANKLGLPPRQIAIWFQNRRARWKNKQLEHDFDTLKSSYDALLADHEAVLADNQWLRSEVLRLTEKLEAKNSGGDQSTGLPQREDGASVEVFDGSAPVVEDRLSNDRDWSLPVVASCNSSYMEPEDIGSYNDGASGGLVYSEEDNGSDDGGAYFSGMFDGGNAALDAGEVERNVDFWHVGCGTGLLFG